MGSAIGQILPEAVGVAISPFPIIAVVLLLASPKGKANALAFLVGWLVGLTLVGTVVLLVADPAGASTESGPATWVGWLVLVLGVLTVLLGFRQWQGRPRGDTEPEMPKWMAAIDGFTAFRAAAIGFILAAANPKNLTLTLAAAAVIASAGLEGADPYIVLAVFVVVGTLGLAIPIGISVAAGRRSAEILSELRHWLMFHNAAIMAVLLIVIGAKLIGSGLQIL